MARVVAGMILAALAIGVATASAGGNSGAARVCQGDGWRDWRTTGGVEFTTQGACVSYAARGGLLASFTTSSSTHTTRTRIDLPTITIYSTRVQGFSTLSGPGAGAFGYTNRLVYDSTVAAAPASAEVSTGFAAATTAIRNDLEAAADNGQILVGGPSLLSSSDNSSAVLVGEVVNHVETTVTSTTTPIGPDTVNINTNTHTEVFVAEQYQTTLRRNSTYGIFGSLTVH